MYAESVRFEVAVKRKVSEETKATYKTARFPFALGLKSETMGKTQARQDFLPLVASLETNKRLIEITDQARPVAVLLSYEHWTMLISKLASLSDIDSRRLDLKGSIQIVGNLDSASKEAGEMLMRAVVDSVEEL